MALLKKISSVVAILLACMLCSGALWAIEIECIDGRPWDDGNIDDPEESRYDHVFDLDPGLNFPLGDRGTWDLEDKEQSFKKFLRGILSFLDQ